MTGLCMTVMPCFAAKSLPSVAVSPVRSTPVNGLQSRSRRARMTLMPVRSPSRR